MAQTMIPTRRYVDVVVFVPLEEELQQVKTIFPPIENVSTTTHWRYLVNPGTTGISMLVVQHDDMGRTAAARALAETSRDFNFGIAVCLGIAGALSSDLNLCDVCYSARIVDVIDNAKALDNGSGELDLDFSTTFYETARELRASFGFLRTMHELEPLNEAWRSERETEAQRILPDSVLGRAGQLEKIGKPKSIHGLLACGAVTKSASYNTKLKKIDRKVLAIETESGGIFEGTRDIGIPTITIRGISDYADDGKTKLEGTTGGLVRNLAASNAASFLRIQLQNPEVSNFLAKRRAEFDKSGTLELPLGRRDASDIAHHINEIGLNIDARLKELAPGFGLREKGYRLPTPRFQKVQFAADINTHSVPDPVDVRDIVKAGQRALLILPRTYPDHSMPWVIASDLLEAEHNGKQVIPIVVDGKEIRPPRHDVEHCAAVSIAGLENSDAHIVYIVDNVPLSSRTRINFLLKDIEAHESASFLFIAKSDSNLVLESEFTADSKSEVYKLGEISFLEIAMFLQKNFDFGAVEAEVVALKLRNAFQKFELSAYPTYFAGIPRESLAALANANRRAELIQLATDGFLTFVVAADKARVALSRTTREKFLRRLVVEMKVHKRSFTQAELASYVKSFSDEFDYGIQPIEFLEAFFEKGILTNDGDKVVFALPFIEDYLLAAELSQDVTIAESYFQIKGLDVDMTAFDLYSEIGAAPKIMQAIVNELRACAMELSQPREKHILLTGQIHPQFLRHQDKIEALQKRLATTAADVQHQRGDLEEKQKLLDMADRVKKLTVRESKSSDPESEKKESTLDYALKVWSLGTTLLGSGAERITGESKRELVELLISLAALITHHWTTLNSKIDFGQIKKKLMEDESIKEAPFYDANEPEESKRIISGLIDIIEFGVLSIPFQKTLHYLCECACNKVLIGSIDKAANGGSFEKVIQGLWLSDIEGKKGKPVLQEAVKALPADHFLRINLASHLLTRVYWSHWQKEDRLLLLDLATEVLAPLKLTIDKSKLIRMVEKSGDVGQSE